MLTNIFMENPIINGVEWVINHDKKDIVLESENETRVIERGFYQLLDEAMEACKKDFVSYSQSIDRYLYENMNEFVITNFNKSVLTSNPYKHF